MVEDATITSEPTGSTIQNFGIYADNFFGGLRILDNDVLNKKESFDCVTLVNVALSEIRDNTFLNHSMSTGAMRGLVLSIPGSHRNAIHLNIFEGNNIAGDNGLRLSHAGENNVVRCNYFKKHEDGAVFNGATINDLTLQQNRFFKSIDDRSVAISGSTLIGDQVHMENEWEQSTLSTGPTLEIRAGFSNGNTFTVDDNLGQDFVPDRVSPNDVLKIETGGARNLEDCGVPGGGNDTVDIIFHIDSLTQRNIDAIEGKFDGTGGKRGEHWDVHFQVYKLLEDSVSFQSMHSNALNYMDSIENSSIDELVDIDRRLEQIMLPEADLDTVELYHDSINLHLDSLQFVYNGYSEEYSESQEDSLLNIVIYLDSLIDVKNDKLNAKKESLGDSINSILNDILEDLNTVTVSDSMERYLKSYFKINVEMLLSSDGELTSGQMDSLESIAEKCYSDNGHGVLLARSILPEHPSTYDDSTYCGSSLILSTNKEMTAELKVIPNPSDGLIEIEGLEMDMVNRIELWNIAGTKLRQYFNQLTPQYDVSQLRSGVYFLKISYSDGRYFRLKFIVQ